MRWRECAKKLGTAAAVACGVASANCWTAMGFSAAVRFSCARTWMGSDACGRGCAIACRYSILLDLVHWRDLVLVVTPAVLILRPEPELMVDFVAEALKQRPALANAPRADLGTGYGALAIGVAAEIAKTNSSGGAARITGDGGALVHVDLSRCCCQPQRRTQRWPDWRRLWRRQGPRGFVVRTSGVDRVCRGGSGYVGCDGCGSFAGIVSKVRYHEPWLALEGGTGPGLDALLPMCTGAALHLIPGGFLVLEPNWGKQVHDVAGILHGMRREGVARVVPPVTYLRMSWCAQITVAWTAS